MWKPFAKKSHPKPIEMKSQVLGTTTELGSFLMLGRNGATTATSALRLYDQSTAVSIPVNYIAEAFASIEPVIKRNGKIETDHPVLDLLRAPTPFFTRELFFETICKHYLITSNAYIIGLGSVNRPPIEIQPISPSNTSEVEGSQGFVNNFIMTPYFLLLVSIYL